jgi:hypothetical protein
MRYCVRAINSIQNKKAPVGRKAEGALAADYTREIRAWCRIWLELVALPGTVAQRLTNTVVEIGYEVKRVIAARAAAIRIDVRQICALRRSHMAKTERRRERSTSNPNAVTAH